MFNYLAPYTPRHWYWLADDGRMFSSKALTTVQPDDADFVDWSVIGAKPTPWPRDDAGEQTDAALQEVLTPYGLTIGGAAETGTARKRK